MSTSGASTARVASLIVSSALLLLLGCSSSDQTSRSPASPTTPERIEDNGSLIGGHATEPTCEVPIRSESSGASVSRASNDVDSRNGLRLPATIEEVLSNLRTAYVDMDYDLYQSLFDPSFTFVFADQDVDHEHIPDSWGLADEMVSAMHMFSRSDWNWDGYIADQIQLSFDHGPEIPNDMEGWTKVVLSRVFLTVHAHERYTGDPRDYRVLADQAYLWFVEQGGLWYIVRWEDRPTGLSPSSLRPTTWGRIKASWR